MRRTQIFLLLPSGVDQSKHMPWRLRRSKGLKLNCLCKSKGLLLIMKEKLLSLRPIRLQNIPDAGRCAQTHNIPCVQIGQTPECHYDDRGWQRQTVRPNDNPGRDSPGIPTPSPMPQQDLSHVRPTIPDGFSFCLRYLFLEMDHKSFLAPVPRRSSLPKGLSLFDSHSAFWLRPPGSVLCNDSTALPIPSLLNSFVNCLAESVPVSNIKISRETGQPTKTQ